MGNTQQSTYSVIRPSNVFSGFSVGQSRKPHLLQVVCRQQQLQQLRRVAQGGRQTRHAATRHVQLWVHRRGEQRGGRVLGSWE